MASTPPAQITAIPDTPPTPLHGAAYDHPYSGRRSARLSTRNQASGLHSTPEKRLLSPSSSTKPAKTAHTPDSARPPPHTSRPAPRSPEATPRPKTQRRVQVISPSSPEPSSFPSSSKPGAQASSHLQPLLSATTTLSEGMLPTPVKTPKKKTVAKIDGAARVLFQDNVQGHTAMELDFNPKRVRRTNKRYNGFSLESFSAEDPGARGHIQIFTDSRDKVPQEDSSESNPFVDRGMNGDSSAQKLAGTSKRRKVSVPRRKDPQVDEAIRNDDGMVYVFRGKKVFRRFDDDDEEEEEIDAEDLGLLEHTTAAGTAVKPLKTLTRKSIKPTRLFQTEVQKTKRELEKEEEAATDIEEVSELSEATSRSHQESPQSGRSLRSATKAAHLVSDGGNVAESKPGKGKRSSPFDSWPRMKSGGRSPAASPKGRKRGLSQIDDDGIGRTKTLETEPKRVRS